MWQLDLYIVYKNKNCSVLNVLFCAVIFRCVSTLWTAKLHILCCCCDVWSKIVAYHSEGRSNASCKLLNVIFCLSFYCLTFHSQVSRLWTKVKEKSVKKKFNVWELRENFDIGQENATFSLSQAINFVDRCFSVVILYSRKPASFQ